ncbi:TPA: hypothetical protein N2D99_002313 [Clostridium botulinum]|nr:hypothetical protein [Clostridium botulinum]
MSNASNIVKIIEDKEKEIKKGETIKIQAETTVKNLRDQYRRVEEDIKELGVDPQKAKEELIDLDKLIEEKLAELDTLIPADVLKKYENYDFSTVQEEKETPNLNMEF